MPAAANLSLLDEVKLQAEVIVPVLRALRGEIGKEAADRIAGGALRQWARDLYHRIGEAKHGTPRQKWDAVWAEDMRPRIGDARPRLATILGLLHLVAGTAQSERDQVANRLFVLNDENAFGGHQIP